MAVYLNASLGKIHEYYRFVDFFYIVKVIEVKGKLKTPEKSWYVNSSEVFLVSIFLIKIDLDLNEGFGFA